MDFPDLSPKQRTAIAFGASLGIAHAAFRALTINLGPVLGLAAGLAFTYAIYWAIALPPRRQKNPELPAHV